MSQTKFIGSSSISVGTSSTQILPTRSNANKRSFVQIFQTSASIPVYISCGQAATTTNGGLLPATVGASITISNFNGSIYGITGSSTATVTVLEGFLNATGYTSISSSSSSTQVSNSSSSSSSTAVSGSSSSSTKVSVSSSSSSTAVSHSSSSSTAVSKSSSSSSDPWKP